VYTRIPDHSEWEKETKGEREKEGGKNEGETGVGRERKGGNNEEEKEKGRGK
jgi:hypothetical protein